MEKRYQVRVNYRVDAPRWWAAARECIRMGWYMPPDLRPLIQGTVEEVEISLTDLRWCKRLPHWDGLDGFPLWLHRIV